MKHIELEALKGCPRHAEGTTFFANSADAKALVALRKAKLIGSEQTYKTRDMGESPLNRDMGESPLNRDMISSPMNRVMTAETRQLMQVQASAAARKLAAQHGIDLTTVKGSSRYGSITINDIQSLIPA